MTRRGFICGRCIHLFVRLNFLRLRHDKHESGSRSTIHDPRWAPRSTYPLHTILSRSRVDKFRLRLVTKPTEARSVHATRQCDSFSKSNGEWKLAIALATKLAHASQLLTLLLEKWTAWFWCKLKTSQRRHVNTATAAGLNSRHVQLQIQAEQHLQRTRCIKSTICTVDIDWADLGGVDCPLLLVPTSYVTYWVFT
jgi:hypothetical protein